MDRVRKEELDEQLKQLALIAQQHPPLAPKRQFALGQMLQAILTSGMLCRPQRGKFTYRYEEIYEEARQELLLYVCQNIDKYNPERGEVMTWCNVLLERRFFREAVPKVLGRPDIQKITESDLDRIVSPEKFPDFTEIIMEYITSDPKGLFKSSYIKDRPEANFQALSQQRLQGKSWQEIAKKYEITVSTISSFYYRCLNRFAAGLKEHCENHLT